MLSVYDLSCAGLRDPRGLHGLPAFSWRLGSTRRGTRQATYHVVVTSMTDGLCAWDSGVVRSSANEVVYAGRQLAPGEVCVWFVEVEDDAGEKAYGVPSSFGMAAGDEAPSCELGVQRRAFVWTSDTAINAELEASGRSQRLDDAVWCELLGVRVDGDKVWARPRVVELERQGLSFAQGSVLLSRGLFVVRWEREGRLEMSVPPGMEAAVALGDEVWELGAGRYVLECQKG